MNLANILVFIQIFGAQADLIFRHLMKNQSLELSCSLQQDLGSLTGLHLYHRSAHSQTTLLSIAEDRELRVDPGLRGRLQLCGGLDSLQVNVTISQLEHSDTGLYMWELSKREEHSSGLVLSAQKVFLLVDGSGRPCQCSSSYPLCSSASLQQQDLLCSRSSGWLRRNVRGRPKLPAPIYEEMTRKQQSTGIPQNNHAAPLHQEEDDFPVYANPNIRQPQDNYYACPRQLALTA
ncbi:hypothetical protein INR49_011169 [Caranx melampygus]|nr:hypothetical protein INR49_011169 [Caranx melampygus]